MKSSPLRLMNRRENVKKELEKAMKFRPSVADQLWGHLLCFPTAPPAPSGFESNIRNQIKLSWSMAFYNRFEAHLRPSWKIEDDHHVSAHGTSKPQAHHRCSCLVRGWDVWSMEQSQKLAYRLYMVSLLMACSKKRNNYLFVMPLYAAMPSEMLLAFPSFGYTLHVTFILPTALGSGAWAPTRFLNYLPDIGRNIGKHWCGGQTLKHMQTHVPFTVCSHLSWNFTTSFFAGKLVRITSPRSASLSRKMSESMWKNCWRPWLQPPAWKSVNGPCKLLPLGSKLRWLTSRKFMLLRMAEDVQANLVCIICLAVEHTRMTVRFVKVFRRLKSSNWNDPKRWHVGHVNQAVCMKLL